MTDKTHEEFKRKLRESDIAVGKVAHYLEEKFGLQVVKSPLSVAPTFDERMEHSDSGDLWVNFALQPRRVEVKELTTPFTCAKDWKWEPHFIVCSKSSFDQADPKPLMYILMNPANTHLAIVKTKTHEHWYAEYRIDQTMPKPIRQLFYFCPLPKVVWHKIDQERFPHEK